MISLSDEQKYAFEKFINNENIFLSGPGGTGKTELIKKMLYSDKKGIQVCAMTGCAALLLGCGAKTIHSWSGIKLANGKKEDVVYNVAHSSFFKKMWRRTKVLIIDEISMMSQKIFEILDEIGKTIFGNNEPFGGIQVVFVGDFYQLPPVGNNEEPETGKFCFQSPLWNHVFKNENQIELTHIFRQSDPLYKSILLEVREGNISDKSIEILKTRLINNSNSSEIQQCSKIFPKRHEVDSINDSYFHKLESTSINYFTKSNTNNTTYIDTGKEISNYDLSLAKKMSDAQKNYEIDNLLKSVPVNHSLSLKEGSRIMCCVNLDINNGICNGSQGVIERFETNGSSDKKYPFVKFDNGVRMLINEYVWQSESSPTISIQQIPLILAWAITTHKIQGATLDSAQIDIGSNIFEYGQTYVALSRIKSLDGLHLTSFEPNKIKANPIVINFYENLKKTRKMITETIIEMDSKTESTNVPIKKSANEKDIKTIRHNISPKSKKINDNSGNSMKITDFWNVKKV